MCHDAYTGRIFVDEYVVRSLMRALSEDMFRVVGIGIGLGVGFRFGGEGQDSGDDRILEPRRQGSVKESILDKVGWPCL